MKLKNGAEYIRSLQQLHPNIYYRGEKIIDVTKHPATEPHVRAAAMTYSLANNGKYKDLKNQDTQFPPNFMQTLHYLCIEKRYWEKYLLSENVVECGYK